MIESFFLITFLHHIAKTRLQLTTKSSLDSAPLPAELWTLSSIANAADSGESIVNNGVILLGKLCEDTHFSYP